LFVQRLLLWGGFFFPFFPPLCYCSEDCLLRICPRRKLFFFSPPSPPLMGRDQMIILEDPANFFSLFFSFFFPPPSFFFFPTPGITVEIVGSIHFSFLPLSPLHYTSAHRGGHEGRNLFSSFSSPPPHVQLAEASADLPFFFFFFFSLIVEQVLPSPFFPFFFSFSPLSQDRMIFFKPPFPPPFPPPYFGAFLFRG